MNKLELSLDALIERMEPYACQRKEDFLKLLKEFPELETSLVLSLESDKKWTEKAATGEVKFIINDNRWKTSEVHRQKPRVVFNFIKGTPVVSLNA